MDSSPQTVTKSELIDSLSEKLRIPAGKVEQVVNCVFDAMTGALEEGRGIEIRGFGSFTVREYQPYMGRNPRTGAPVPVAAKRLPFFKVGKELKERVNNGTSAPTKSKEPAPTPVNKDLVDKQGRLIMDFVHLLKGEKSNASFQQDARAWNRRFNDLAMASSSFTEQSLITDLTQVGFPAAVASGEVRRIRALGV